MTPEALLEALRTGLAATATPEQRAAAAEVCRSALAKLEPTPAELPAVPGDQVGQMLDALIARLKAVPPRAKRARIADSAPSPRIPFVPTRRQRP